MNGRIWVESEMNKGTTFFMAIYFQTDKKGMTIWDEKDISVLSNKHVLILDPSENSRKMISLQCHDWGMQSRSVQTKEELIKILSVERNVDFILADYELAKNPEYDITEILDDVNKKARFRIIYMLNNTLINPDNKQHHFIHKPIRKLQLLNILLKSGFEQADNKTAEENNLINRKNNLNILLAEDNVINQKLFERMISQIGYPIDIAQDGVNAVKMASLKKYDLIFMDLQMPEMDGLEATRTIMRNAREPKPNIIAMTANIQKKDKEQCFEAGMIDYLAKPVSYLKIKSILDYWQNVKLQKPA
jgi:CheY-like chemotaxis protein